MAGETESQGDGGHQALVFSAKRFVLLGLCEKVVAVVPTRDFQPILKNFLVEVSPGALRMVGTDLELSVVASTPSVSTSDTGAVAFPAKRLLAILREAPEGDVTVDVSKAKARVTAGDVAWDLRLADARDYPALFDLDAPEFTQVSREGFAAALRTVRHAVGRDGARPPLMMVDITDGKATASDGVRFQRSVIDGFPGSMQVPAAAVEHLLRILAASEAEMVGVADYASFLVFQVGSSVFLTSKLMARFLDVERLMLKPALGNTQVLAVDKDKLAEAVRRVRITSDEETSAIGLRLSPGKLTVFSQDKDGNAAEQEIAAGWEHGQRLLVVNHAFLTALLEVWPYPQCKFRLGTDTARKKSLILLTDSDDGEGPQAGVIQQMHGVHLGYA